jgi:hypothetical protein
LFVAATRLLCLKPQPSIAQWKACADQRWKWIIDWQFRPARASLAYLVALVFFEKAKAGGGV